ncbi:MAG: nucleoside triphosphate pyrophosphohydrolase [Candidatus Marinimicrobia bacterium]|nr:nucleoside triphosphate pyrophosphohydrolase [Candidatus Neomarinimicrobiota bacterium]
MPEHIDIKRLLEIMARLRDPVKGCPWDLEQTFETIAPYTIEEAYEVADAIARNDMKNLKRELGDLLFQSIYHAQMAEEAGYFDFSDVVNSICQKMVKRHPHVFGEGRVKNASDQVKTWEDIKANERIEEAKSKITNSDKVYLPGALDGLPGNLPSIKMAEKLQKRAARVGFDWSDTENVINKIREELIEVVQEFQADDISKVRLTDEIGDLLFACINLSRKAKVDPETALRVANLKFERRFRRIEELLALQGRTPNDANLSEMENLWMQTKAEERANRDL